MKTPITAGSYPMAEEGKKEFADRPDKIAERRDQGSADWMMTRRLKKPWGTSEVIESRAQYQIKILEVDPGQALSLQYHRYRAESWLVLEGSGTIELNGKKKNLFRGDAVTVPIGSRHRLSNPGKLPLRVVEIQTGEYFGEDDIVRLEDNYGRISPSGDIS